VKKQRARTSAGARLLVCNDEYFIVISGTEVTGGRFNVDAQWLLQLTPRN